MAALEGLAPGLMIEIIAQAVNGPSQSVPSGAIFVTIPATESVAAKPAVSESELAPLNAIVPNGSSNGNGNGNGSHAVASRLS